MAKRPLCVICSCFILLLLVLGQTQAAALLEERLPEKTVQALQAATSGRIYGQIYLDTAAGRGLYDLPEKYNSTGSFEPLFSQQQ